MNQEDLPAGDETADHSDATEAPPQTIQLDQFLKAHRLVDTGGQAKYLIQCGDVTVNGSVETRRRKKLVANDIVGFDGCEYQVEFES